MSFTQPIVSEQHFFELLSFSVYFSLAQIPKFISNLFGLFIGHFDVAAADLGTGVYPQGVVDGVALLILQNNPISQSFITP